MSWSERQRLKELALEIALELGIGEPDFEDDEAVYNFVEENKLRHFLTLGGIYEWGD